MGVELGKMGVRQKAGGPQGKREGVGSDVIIFDRYEGSPWEIRLTLVVQASCLSCPRHFPRSCHSVGTAKSKPGHSMHSTYPLRLQWPSPKI